MSTDAIITVSGAMESSVSMGSEGAMVSSGIGAIRILYRSLQQVSLPDSFTPDILLEAKYPRLSFFFFF